jgi:hypothetical protein
MKYLLFILRIVTTDSTIQQSSVQVIIILNIILLLNSFKESFGGKILYFFLHEAQNELKEINLKKYTTLMLLY